jgi:GNAT superfamily N-acetyltransferase
MACSILKLTKTPVKLILSQIFYFDPKHAKYTIIMLTEQINLYRQAEDYFFRNLASKCLSLSDSATAYRISISDAPLNVVYIRKTPENIEAILEKTQAFYEAEHLPFTIFIPHAFSTPAVKKAFQEKGYLKEGQTVSMQLSLEAFNPPPIMEESSFQSTSNRLEEWMIPLAGAFESSTEIVEQYAKAHQKVLEKNLHFYHFSLYHHNRPIVSLTLSIQQSIARIDDVGTLPEFQKKGYATKLMRYALSQAKQLGASQFFLEASAAGFPVYQKLGFTILFKSDIYSLKKEFNPRAIER